MAKNFSTGIVLTSVFNTGNTSEFTMLSKDFNKRAKTFRTWSLSFCYPSKSTKGYSSKDVSLGVKIQ